MREVKRQKEKGKMAGDELRQRTPIPSCPERLRGCLKIREIRVSNPCLSVCIRGSNPVFEIKKPSNTSEKPSNPIKVNQGFFPQKNSQFFSRPFYGKYWEIPQKPPKKRCPNALKMMQFLTCWQRALAIQNENKLPAYPKISLASLRIDVENLPHQSCFDKQPQMILGYEKLFSR